MLGELFLGGWTGVRVLLLSKVDAATHGTWILMLKLKTAII